MGTKRIRMRRKLDTIAAHPEDRDANIVIFDFYDDEEMTDETEA